MGTGKPAGVSVSGVVPEAITPSDGTGTLTRHSRTPHRVPFFPAGCSEGGLDCATGWPPGGSGTATALTGFSEGVGVIEVTRSAAATCFLSCVSPFSWGALKIREKPEGEPQPRLRGLERGCDAGVDADRSFQ